MSPEIQHPWFFDVDIAHRCLRCQFSGFIDTILRCERRVFLCFKERRSIYLLVKPINLLQLFISQGLVDLLTHSGRCFVELLLESHSFLSRWPALVDENINTLKFGFYIFLTAN